MASPKIDVILHALTGIRAQTVAYHQMRTQAVVFICGLAVAAAGFTLGQRDHPGWQWVGLIGPMTFLLIAFFLSTYFRHLIDRCQCIEGHLYEELSAVMNTVLSPDQALKPESAVYALVNPAKAPLSRAQLRKLILKDGPQLAILGYTTIYLVFWLWWFSPWR